MSKTYYKPGDYNALCDRCGRKYKASQLRLTWDNLRVCSSNKCYEERHIADFFKGRPDNQSVPWTRPDDDSGEIFTGRYFVDDYFENDDYFGDV